MFLDVSQLSVQYTGLNRAAVDRVSLGLRAGEMGVLIGPSGCGKTTLWSAVWACMCHPKRAALAWCFKTMLCFRT
jgi:ABC-type taurine transport system ATPase subunit